MEKCKPINTPLVLNEKLIKEDKVEKIDASVNRSLIGCLLYLTSTRLDIMYAGSLLSRFMHNPSELHFKVVKKGVEVCQRVKKILESGLNRMEAQD